MDDLIDIVVAYRLQIAGALILAFLAAYLTGLNNRRNRLAVAAAKFRDTFHIALKGLYPIPSDWPKDFKILDEKLREELPNLQSAIDEFRLFIPWYRRWFFDRAWRIYRLGKDGRSIDQQYYAQYKSGQTTTNPKGKEITITCDGKVNLRRNVERLLSYAKQK